MKIKAFAPIRNFDFEVEHVDLAPYFITNNEEHKNTVCLANDYDSQFGEFDASDILSNYVYIWKGDTATSSDQLLSSMTDISKIANAFGYLFKRSIEALWFVKDNAAYVHKTFVLEENEYNAGVSYLLNGYYDSQGESTVQTFTIDELSSAFDVVKKLQIFEDKERVNLDKHHKANNIQPENYNVTKLYRITLFLQNYRTTKNPVIRIANVMSLYETLFIAADNINIGNTLRERVAIFIGGTNDEKDDIRILIKQAYNIRSRYIHGDPFKVSTVTLLDFSRKIDELTRKVLNKLLFMNDNSIFQHVETKSNKKKFEAYFNNLIENQITPT